MARSPQLQKYLNSLVGDSALNTGRLGDSGVNTGRLGDGSWNGGGELMKALQEIVAQAQGSRYNSMGVDPNMFSPMNPSGSNYPTPQYPSLSQLTSPVTSSPNPSPTPPLASAIHYQDSPINTMRQQGGGTAVAAAPTLTSPANQISRMYQTLQNQAALNSIRNSIGPTTTVANPRATAQSAIAALAAALNRK